MEIEVRESQREEERRFYNQDVQGDIFFLSLWWSQAGSRWFLNPVQSTTGGKMCKGLREVGGEWGVLGWGGGLHHQSPTIHHPLAPTGAVWTERGD